ncbi:AcrR family transcriptional regulator [Silvimonas terrae]|uniref:AcrR family transcriptional regulator n=1 Tax=Silvimonas terrae TaxID=300266 RepID=A0A840RB53_9NEIS|nr:TetR/AcrR family transcriptional regulator [Silvimonas terrae]MBB5190137.1 AcrR family transcriptional regulator [Silvimonas terrae]
MARIATVADALFKERGYENVTMELIAATVSVSKRTLYKYFPVKDAILACLLEDELARDLAQVEPALLVARSFRTGASGLLAASAHWCETHPDYLLPYVRFKFATFEPGLPAETRRDMVQVWTALITMGQQTGELDASQDAGQLALQFHFLYFGALMRWLSDRQLSLASEFEAALRLFVEGAREPAEPQKQGITPYGA